jgi:hypothetical protein
MIAEIMLALLYWLLGVLFALGAFCALGCVISLFLSVLTSFKSPMRLLGTPLWVFFSFLALGVCWLLQWAYLALGENAVRYWFFVGAFIPGILGVTLVPKLVALATGGSKPATPTTLVPPPINPAKV